MLHFYSITCWYYKRLTYIMNESYSSIIFNNKKSNNCIDCSLMNVKNDKICKLKRHLCRDIQKGQMVFFYEREIKE